MKAANTQTDDVMNYHGLSAYLKMSYGTLRHWVMKGKIPCLKVGKSVRFSKKQIDLWLEKYHRQLKQVKNESGNDNNGELFSFSEDKV